MNYEYRIIKYEEGDEVSYCVEELKDTLEEMKQSFTKPILGSFPSVKREGCFDE